MGEAKRNREKGIATSSRRVVLSGLERFQCTKWAGGYPAVGDGRQRRTLLQELRADDPAWHHDELAREKFPRERFEEEHALIFTKASLEYFSDLLKRLEAVGPQQAMVPGTEFEILLGVEDKFRAALASPATLRVEEHRAANGAPTTGES